LNINDAKIFIKIIDKKIVYLNFIFLLCGILRSTKSKEKAPIAGLNA